MIIATTLSVLTGLTSLDTPITFEAPGERLDVIVERLAEATGSDLTIGAEEHGHYLTISVADMPLEELLDGIARVTVMSWMPDRGGLRLVPNVDRRKEIADEQAAERAEQFKHTYEEWIRAQRKALAEMGEFNPLDERGSENMYQRIYMGFYLDVFGAVFPYVDPERVGRLQPGERVVFATDPTRMQVPLRGVPPRTLTALTESLRVFHADRRTTQSMPSARDLYQVQANSESNVHKVAIGIKRDPRSLGNAPSYDIEFTLFERRGGQYLQVHRGSETLQFLDMDKRETSEEQTTTLQSLGMEPVEEVSYGDLVTASLESPENSVLRRRFQHHSAAFQEIVLNLSENDPQSQIVAPYIMQLGEQNDVQVIANVSDRSAFLLLVRAAGTLPLAPFELLAPTHEVELKDEVLFVSPIDVARSAADRVEREYVSEYISRFRGHRQIPLDAQIEFFRTTDGLYSDSGSLIMRFALSSTAQNDNFVALRLLSRASNAEVDSLLTNVVIPYQQLSAPLRQVIHDWIYNHEVGLSLDEREIEENFDDYIMTSSPFQEPAAFEVTEIFSEGIPVNTILRVRAAETLMFVNEIDQSPATMHVNILQDVFNYARNRAYLENAPPAATTNFVRIDNYYAEEAEYYGFQLQFGPHFRNSFSAVDLDIGPGAAAYHFTQFPPEVAEHVRRATDRMRNDPRFNYIFNPPNFGGQKPPE